LKYNFPFKRIKEFASSFELREASSYWFPEEVAPGNREMQNHDVQQREHGLRT
jgi:hypothetical protein